MKYRTWTLLSATILVGACSTLPSSGPTGSQVRKASLADTQLGIRIIEVDSAAQLPVAQRERELNLTDLPPPPTDMVGPGDLLGISIYEAGVALFGSASSSSAVAAPNGFDAGVKAQTLPQIRVDDNGDIRIPYAGKIRVLGRTVAEIEQLIRKSLKGYSQDPQIVVTRAEVISNAIIIGGEVSRAGRLVLQTNRESLSDAIALSGGYKGNANDLLLRVTRSGASSEMRLSRLLADPRLDFRTYPGDRITLISDPQSFSVLGAAGRMDQVAFTGAALTLAEAVAKAGGPNPSTGDPAAIFVFRYVEDPDGMRVPVVYHVNMMKTGSYFLAQNFVMQDKDVLYFGNAGANQPSKLIQLVSQLFTPILTVTNAISVIQNSN